MMPTSDICLDLFRHLEWAEASVWRVALAAPQAGEDARLLKLLFHAHLVQQAFLKVWQGQPFEWPNEADFTDLKSLYRFGCHVHQELAAFMRQDHDEAVLNAPLNVPWSAFVKEKMGIDPASVTMKETMHQVVMHSSYHRGQVNARLRELGAEPPIVDFICWVWLGRPAPEWPEAMAIGD